MEPVVDEDSGPLFFEEDEIFMSNEKGLKCGTVIESYIDTMYSDEDDLLDDASSLKRGKVRVTWYPTGQEKVVDETKLSLIERSLMPGDIVRRSNRPGSQKGFVTDCVVRSHLQVKGTHQIISDIDSKLLVDFFPYGSESVYVELDGWIGRTLAKQHYKVTVDFADGARCTVHHTDLDEFDDIFDIALNRREDSEFINETHYKGQKLKGHLCDLKNGDWIKSTKQFCAKTAKDGKKNRKPVIVTVAERVQVTKVNVDWMMCGITATSPINPGRSISGAKLARLRMLDPFVHATAQLGDSFYYTIQHGDRIEAVAPENKLTVTQYLLSRVFSQDGDESVTKMNIQNTSQTSASAADSEIMLEEEGEKVTTSESTTDLATVDGEEDGEEWEDLDSGAPQARVSKVRRGRKKKRAAASKPKPAQNFENLELKPGDAVPIEVVLSQSFADVMWQDGTFDRGLSSRELYCIYHMDDNEFFPGDYIVRAEVDTANVPEEYGVIVSVDCEQRIAQVRWLFSAHGQSIPFCTIECTELSVYEIKDHPVFTFRPGAAVIRTEYDERESLQCCEDDAVGSVISMHCDGTMSIKWVDGCISQCYPEQLILVANMHESSDEDDDSDDDSSLYDGSTDDSDVTVDSLGDVIPAALDQHRFRRGDVEFAELISQLLGKLESAMSDYAQISSCKMSVITSDLLDLMLYTRMFYKNLLDVSPHSETEALKNFVKQTKDFQRVLRAHSQCTSCIELIRSGAGSDVMSDLKDMADELHSSLEDGDFECPAELEYINLVLNLYETTKEAEDPSPCDQAASADSPVTDTAIAKAIKNLDDFMAKQYAEGATMCTQFLQQLLQACLDYQDVKLMKQEAEKLIGSIENTTNVSPADENPEAMDIDQSFYVNPEEVKKEQIESSIKYEETDVKAKTEIQTVTDVKTEPEESETVEEMGDEEIGAGFGIVGTCPPCHNYQSLPPSFSSVTFNKAIQKEFKLLSTNLPEGIFVRSFGDRSDLLSAMIVGSAGTPYEDALFVFDIMLRDYPTRPPTLFYHSYCTDRLNPNLYEEGKVCVSLLGTWSGRNNEKWNPSSSTLLQVLVSIQGLILNAEPYFNEAGYEKQRGTSAGIENSKKYNEMVLIKVIQSMIAMVDRPHTIFKHDIIHHWKTRSVGFMKRMQGFMGVSSVSAEENGDNLPKGTTPAGVSQTKPDFPLLPLTKGCTLTLEKLINKFEDCLKLHVCAKP